MIIIDVKKQIKTYGGLNLLEVQTSFSSQRITQVLGLSGAGKTTLLKMLAGLVQPDYGTITVDETTWFDKAAGISLETPQRQVGFVFQDYALFPNMTVEKQLLYGTSDTNYIKRLLQIGRMESFIHHKPRQLSGGQQQRLAILRALSTRPKLLLMDEPFSALDNALKAVVIMGLKELFIELELTCLVVTHQSLAGEFADYSFEMS